jgi:hypothetical protein
MKQSTMSYSTYYAIMDYKKTVEAFKQRYYLACRLDFNKRFESSYCVPSYNKAVNEAFKRAMKVMYKSYKGHNMFYKNQLLRAALGFTSIHNSPDVWHINGCIVE